MASPIIIPFDNNPQSTTIKTTAYTIPSGKFARVRNLHGDLTIDTIPHYTVLGSFTRTLTTSTGATDSLAFDSNLDFVKCTRSSTLSNSNNHTTMDYYTLYYSYSSAGIPPIAPVGNTSVINATSGLFYNDLSFTGTRVSYIRPVSGCFGYYGTINTTAGAYALGFGSYRVSGTVTHSAIAASFDKNEFWVPSGTVLDGLKYMVTEYNNIS